MGEKVFDPEIKAQNVGSRSVLSRARKESCGCWCAASSCGIAHISPTSFTG
jgi:hypothetical protein